MDTNALVIHRAAAHSQFQEVMLYIFGHLPPSQIFENETVLAAFRGFIERVSDGELSKLSLVKKVVAPGRPTTPGIKTKDAITIITGCVDTLSNRVDPQTFWQKKAEIFEQCSAENSPVIRFKRIDCALSKLDLEAELINRVLKVLLSYEYENVLLEYKNRNNDANALDALKDTNAYVAKALDIEVKRLKNLRSEASKYLALMDVFGPGILFVLGGTRKTWRVLSNGACTVVKLYLTIYLHKVVELATSLNLTAAKIILDASRLGGTIISIPEFQKTELGKVILKYIRVLDDGTLVAKNSPCVLTNSGVYQDEYWRAVEDIHSTLTPPTSSRESTPANDRSSTATPEASTHDSDTVPTPTEHDATFSSSRGQQSGPGLFTFESRGRKRPREIDNIDDELSCDGRRYDNTEVSLSDSCPRRTISDTIDGEAAVSHDSSAELQAEPSSVIPQSSGEEQTPSVQLDLTHKRCDANQTASRKRRGGIDTRQAEKIVKRALHHESSSAQQGTNESDESHPHRTRTASGTAVRTHDSSADTQTDPFSVVEVSLAETEESPELSMSTGRDGVSTHEAADGSGHTISSEPTSLTDQSTSRETPNRWIAGAGLDCNLRIQTVNHEPSTEQDASVLYVIRNQEAGSRISHSLPQSFEALGQPIQQFQQSETIQSFALYDQIPLMADLSQPPAERTVQDGAQSYVPCGSQGFEEIYFETRHPIDPHGFDEISFDSQGNAWFAKDSQGFEQVSFDSQNRIWQPAPSQGFECISFNEDHTAMSW